MRLDIVRNNLKDRFNNVAPSFVVLFKVNEQIFSYFCSSLMLIKERILEWDKVFALIEYMFIPNLSKYTKKHTE